LGDLLPALLLLALTLQPGVARAGTAIHVTTTADDLAVNGNCTLREAVVAANTDASVDACPAGAGADTILLPAGVYRLALQGRGEGNTATGDLDVRGTLSIAGAGKGLTIIDGGLLDRVFEITSGAAVDLTGMTVANGDPGAGDGGGILVQPAASLRLANSEVSGNRAGGNQWGGGIRNNGTATLDLTDVVRNTAGYAGGIHNNGTLTMTRGTVGANTTTYFAGGIYNAVMLTLDGVTVSGNTAGTNGGGLYSPSGLTRLTNCTVSGNKARSLYGGGIWVYYGAAMTLTNTTISNNSSLAGAGICYMEPPDQVAGLGFVPAADEVKFQNSLLANNSGPNCTRTWLVPPIMSLGHNLDTDATCAFGGPGDLNKVSALLGTLQNNGGPTWTHALQSGSPAIDAGDDAACPQTDQRGLPRPVDGDGDGVASCDIGAFEAGAGQMSRLFLPLIQR
jgi:CSLREA domain-containing protein